MATSSISHRWKYDVFVSFRGEDIRKNFMDHMFNDFKQKGIHAFRDDNELPKGEEISPRLYRAIEESRFLIVIFSKDYASSSWCLRELVQILECKQTENPKHEVRIIFYDVKPDVVREQKGSYAEAFRNYEVLNRAEVGKWKEALFMAADLSGFDLQDMTNGYESKFIDCISKEILKKLCDGPLHVGDYLVGIDFHFDKLELSRFIGSYKVNMIGICGISGIGKTTLAKAIYNLMYIHFEGSCFCDDVQGVEKRQGLMQVQMKMIGKILKREDLKISSVGEGSMVIKQRMACKKLNGSLDFLSNELRLFCWHGCPFKYLPPDFYPENIVAIDLSYSNIKQLWTTPKSFRRLKLMKLRYCCNLTTTPDFSDIRNLDELNLEGCVNLVSVHSSIGMLTRLVVLNLRDCKQLRIFPSRVEMDFLQVLNLSGCLKLNRLPEDLGRIKSLTKLHVDRTAITELPSFVSSLINLESLSFGGQGRIQPRWWTSITDPFGLLSKQQHPQISVSFAGLHMLKSLNFSYCNLVQVPESIGSLSSLEYLNLQGNDFTSFPESLGQLSHLFTLELNGCKKLEVLPELPPSVDYIYAYDCTSLREVSGLSKDSFRNRYNIFINCPKLFKNVTIDSEGSISKTQCVDSSITSKGSIHRLSAFLGYLGVQTNRCEFFLQDNVYSDLYIIHHGNSIPEWFTNRSTENHVKVELPSDWCFNKFRGYGICVVFKCKKPNKFKGYPVKNNFDGASMEFVFMEHLKNEVIGIHESYMIWLNYTRSTGGWEEAKNFVTFCFEEKEGYEVKECGVRVICDGDLQQGDVTNLSMFEDLPILSQHANMVGL